MTSKKLNTIMVMTLLCSAFALGCTSTAASGGNSASPDGGLGADLSAADAGGDASSDASTQNPNADTGATAAPDVAIDNDAQAPEDVAAAPDVPAVGLGAYSPEDAVTTPDVQAPQDAAVTPDTAAPKDVAIAKDTAAPDAGPVCGDGVCATGETTASCPGDCPAPKTCTTYADVQPIFLNNCNGCHGHAFGNSCTAAAKYATINTYVQSGAMPQGGSLSAADKATVSAWAAAKNACTTASCP